MSFSGGRRGGTEGPLLWLSVFPCAIVPLDLMSHKVQGSYGKGWAARLFDLFSRISHIRTNINNHINIYININIDININILTGEPNHCRK